MLFAPAQVTFDCNFSLHFPRHRQDNHDRRGSHETGGKICNGNYRIKVVIKVKSDSNYSCCAANLHSRKRMLWPDFRAEQIFRSDTIILYEASIAEVLCERSESIPLPERWLRRSTLAKG